MSKRVCNQSARSGGRTDYGNLRQKKVLIAGGGGFVGTSLTRRLLKDGHRITCLDSFVTGQLSNLDEFLSNPRFQLVEQDILDCYQPDEKFDQIYNLACPASPPQYQKDPVHTLITNVNGSLNLLNLAKDANARIFLASTSEVYGDPTVHPQTEAYRGNVNTTGPRSCYDEGKRCAETLYFDFARLYGLEIRVARIFNTYGPNMHAQDGRVVSNFVLQALTGQDITIQGDGRQTRSFCYIDDLVEAFTKLMNIDAPFLGPVNLGNPVEITVLELAETIINLTGSVSRIVHVPQPLDDPSRRKPDISLAEEALGWTPKVSLKLGLEKNHRLF